MADVLDRDAIRQRFSGITSEVVNAFIADLLLEGVLYDPIPRVFTLPRHPDDRSVSVPTASTSRKKADRTTLGASKMTLLLVR